MTYLFLKYFHVLGAIVLLGTGAGIAFFMLMAHRTGDVTHIARTAKTVVHADFLFTATAVIAQPATGYFLVIETGLPLTHGWIITSLVLYVMAGFAWLPVVWIQIRMRDLAHISAKHGINLPPEYYRLFRLWVILGFPGFAAVMAIIWLMIFKPSL